MKAKSNFIFVSYGLFQINLVEKVSPLQCKLKNKLSCKAQYWFRNRRWSFNNQNSELYLGWNLLLSFSWDSFQVAFCLGEWVFGWLFLLLFLLIWNLPALTSGPCVIGVCERKKWDKKVFPGMPSAVSCLGLSGPASGHARPLSWSTLVDPSGPHIWGLLTCHASASKLLFCVVWEAFCQHLELWIYPQFLIAGVPSPF